jgi:carbamoyl-phosphate synthase large subunit
MKATGEVMAIDRTFEAALMKAIRGLEVKQKDLRHEKFQAQDDVTLEASIMQPTDDRIWAIIEGIRRGWELFRINKICKVDKWFLKKIQNLIEIEIRLREANEDLSQLIEAAFLIGFPSPTILDLLTAGRDEEFRKRAVAEVEKQKVQPVFKMVDTCAGEFESKTPYYYGTFEVEDDVVRTV